MTESEFMSIKNQNYQSVIIKKAIALSGASSQEEFGRMSGISQSCVNFLINGIKGFGKIRKPYMMSVDLAIRIAIATNFRLTPKEIAPYIDFGFMESYINHEVDKVISSLECQLEKNKE